MSSAAPTASLPRPSQAVARQHVRELASEYLRELIFTGVLAQGDRIPQDAIAEALGLSRLPVREAVTVLERDGFIVVHPHRGAFVAAFDEDTIREQFEIYGVLHAWAVKRAAQRGQAELAAQLSALVAAMQASLDDLDEFERLVVQFHRVINRAGGSRRLGGVMRSMFRVLPGNFSQQVPGAARNTLDGVKGITTAVERDDRDEAAAICEGYLRRNGDLLVDLLRQRGVFKVVER
jgi:DNA-binding GntR family transcriptional regulator